MSPVNILGQYSPCIYNLPGIWSAELAGEINLGLRAPGACVCTAGTSDVYESQKWGKCDRANPQWCDVFGNGNACPDKKPVVPQAPVNCASEDPTFSNKQVEAMNLAHMRASIKLAQSNGPAMAVQY
jgi:hypothetical protein